ncbi:hypothetical protein HY3_16260 [Hyphomonas pacifica]|uniref:DUF2946 domain-containing protein n=2 Tax=Hyphomonas pacifica TaxID=1280941 RepID=A0A8B2PKY5_9PROT|nr:hypothetical protein HY3_16260 [Hyphomonas pacifica]
MMTDLLRHLRTLALLLIVAGLGVRGAVPSGYMLDSAADGSIIIRLCGDGAGRLMRLDPQTRTLTSLPADYDPDAPPTDDQTDQPDCPYAVTAAFDLPHTPSLLVQPAAFGLPLLGARPYAVPLRERPIDSRLPARGPPLSRLI